MKLNIISCSINYLIVSFAHFSNALLAFFSWFTVLSIYLVTKRCCKYIFPACNLSLHFFQWVFSETEMSDFNVVELVNLCLNGQDYLDFRGSYGLAHSFVK